MNLNNYVNTLTAEDFEEGPHGRSVLKGAPEAYYQMLREFNNNGIDVKWQAVTAGRHSNGVSFFVGNLTLTERSETGALISEQTLPGAAEGESPQMGISGVMTTALGNALLRGLGKAEFIYEGAEEQAPPQQQQQPQYQPPQQQQPQYQPPAPPQYPQGARRPFPGQGNGGGYNRPPQQQGGGQRNFGPWDGSRVFVKTGNFANQPYSNIPIEQLQRWASGDSPNQNAIKELQARMNSGGGAPDMNNAFGNNGGGY